MPSKILHFLLILCLSLSLQAKGKSSPTNTSAIFFKGTFVELRQEANFQKKPFFVYFYTSWCGPCGNMDKFSFTDPNLESYVKQNYLGYRVDAEGLGGDGIELAQRFQVLFFPTLVIFNAKGEELKRMSGYQSAVALLGNLKEFGATSSGAAPPPVVTPAPKPKPKPTPVPKPAPKPPVTNQPQRNQSVSDLYRELFEISVYKIPAKGFAVQVGVYGDYSNVLRQVGLLEEKDHDVMVSINQINKKVVFKLMLGPFLTRSEAKAYKDRLKTQENRNGMVIDLGG